MRSLVPMRRLYSTGGTSIQVLSAATAQATGARASVNHQRVPCVTDLGKVASPAHVLCSVRSLLADKGKLALARKGVDTRSFHIVDAKGQYVNCLGIGENATCEDLAVGNEVSIFFTRAAAGGSEAEQWKLWIYDKTMALLRGAGRESPRNRAEIRILNGYQLRSPLEGEVVAKVLARDAPRQVYIATGTGCRG